MGPCLCSSPSNVDHAQHPYMIPYPLTLFLQFPLTLLNLFTPASLEPQLSLISVPLDLTPFYNNKGASLAGQHVEGGFDGRGGTYAVEELPKGRVQIEGVWVSTLPSRRAAGKAR
jgi:hypothetical protein